MITNYDARAARSRYNQDAILSASPSRLVTMLFDRLLLDLQRAEAAQVAGDWATASPQLTHAQDIIAELSGTLDVERWDGAQSLLSVYLFSSTLMMKANIERSVDATRQAIELLEPLRQTWHEAAAIVSAVSNDLMAPRTDGMLGVA